MGFVAQLKARLGERYDVLREVSIAFQLGQMGTADYCDLALDILDNDSQTLLRLVGKVPDAALRDSVTEYLHLLASSAQRVTTFTAASAAAVAPPPPPTASMAAVTLDMVNGERVRSASLTRTSFEQEAAAGDRGGEPCPICMDAEPSVRCEPCGHALCKACLQRWQHSCANPAYAAATSRGAQTAAPCPFCRATVKHYSPLLSASPLPATPAPTSPAAPPQHLPHRARCEGCGPPSTSSTGASVVMWFRQDLRLADNPALSYAASLGLSVIPVFVLAPDDEEGQWPLGGASRYWLHHSLRSLDRSLRATFGSRLILRCPPPGQRSVDELMAVIRETGARTVVYNRVYEPWRLARDAAAEAALMAQGIRVSSFNALLLYEPWDAQPDRCDDACWNSGFGSVRFFLRGCEPLGPPGQPVSAPARLRPPISWPCCAGLKALRLAELPRRRDDGTPIDWAVGIRQHWRFGEEGALAALEEFVDCALEKFDTKGQVDKKDTTAGGGGKPPSERFRADRKNTARISPYMHFGELGPRQVYHRVLEKQAASGGRRDQRSVNTFLRRLAWRDLAYWALWRFPNTALSSMRPQYESQRWDLGWSDADNAVSALSVKKQRWGAGMRASADPRLRAWQRGETGYPLVDAAMTELWITGYMTNYMRHIVAGFLIEYLNIDWRHGELWFHDTLIDADVAIQAMMWQNGGHSGMDQWNFVMHPVFAAKACDPDGDYVRQWLPQLRNLPREFIHCPWEAPATMLAAAGVSLGRQYPKRILIDLEAARRNSLAAVVDMRLKQGAKFVLPDGNEALRLPDGRMARCITRVDYKVNAKEPMTKQTAATAWDKSRRPARDFMSVAMAETTGQAHRTAASRR